MKINFNSSKIINANSLNIPVKYVTRCQELIAECLLLNKINKVSIFPDHPIYYRYKIVCANKDSILLCFIFIDNKLISKFVVHNFDKLICDYRHRIRLSEKTLAWLDFFQNSMSIAWHAYIKAFETHPACSWKKNEERHHDQ